MAHIYDGQGDRQRAIENYQQSVEIYREIGDQWAITHPLCDLAWKTWDQGDTQKARALMEEHLAAFQKIQTNMIGLSMALGYIVMITSMLGDIEMAERYVLERNEIHSSYQQDSEYANILADTAYLDFISGRLTEAHQKLEKALEIARRKPDNTFRIIVLKSLGNVLCQEGQVSEAIAYLEESLLLSKTTVLYDPYLIPELQADYAKTLSLNQQLQEAQDLYCHSLEGICNSLPRIPRCLEGLAEVACAQGDHARAVILMGAAQEMRQRMNLPILPVYEKEYHRFTVNLREGFQETEFRSIWEAGAKMPFDECVEYALAVRNWTEE